MSYSFSVNLSRALILLSVIFATSCASVKPKTQSSSRSHVERSKVIENAPRNSIIQTAEKYIGVPYVYGGKNPKGFDCSGFTTYVFAKNQVKLSGSSRHQSTLGREKNPNKAVPGDLVFFLTKGEVRHVGIVTENNQSGLWVIHSTSSKGVIKQNISKSSYWSKKKYFVKDILG